MDPNAVFQTAVAHELAREFARRPVSQARQNHTRRYAVMGAVLVAVLFLVADSFVRQQTATATEARIEQAGDELLANRDGMEAPDASRTLARR